MEGLIQWDINLLLTLNGLAGQFSWLDQLMLLFSSKLAWIPLYAVFAFFNFRTFGFKGFLWVVLTVICLLILTDQGSVVLFKEKFQRLRPCHFSELKSQVILVSGRCGGQYGFISSHAANVFGISTLIGGLLFKKSRLWSLLFGWAALVSLSRVYLGVHYPTDVFVGALYGVTIGFACLKVGRNVIDTR